MMSADPFIQDPTNGQSLNRYAYVINNPLAYTDPNGFFFKSIFRAIGNIVSNPRAIIAIAAAVAIGHPELALAKSIGAVGAGAIGGAVAGGISGGNLKSVVTGAITGAAFGALGDHIQAVADAAAAQTSLRSIGVESLTVAYTGLEKAALHAAVGGITSVIQGADFKSGFLAAGFAKLAGPILPDQNEVGLLGATAVRSVVGGLAATVGGGNFANGATTAAFGYLFNQAAHELATLWTNAKTLETTFERHGHQFGNIDEKTFTSMARNQLLNAANNPNVEVTRADDRYRVYDRVKNTFGAYTLDGKIITFFKPGSGYNPLTQGVPIDPNVMRAELLKRNVPMRGPVGRGKSADD
jgi:hypothetical protein